MKLRTRLAYALIPPEFWPIARWEYFVTRARLSAWLSPAHHRRLRALRSSRGLRIHLGCGRRIMPGWVNVDALAGEGVDLTLDVRRPLPFTSGSARLIYTEHMIEHLTHDEADQLLQECRRVLEPGGRIRIGVPDAGLYMRKYVAGDPEFFHFVRHLGGAVQPLRTPMLAINQMMRMGTSHRSGWDYETLALALTEAGFTACTRRASGEGSPELVLDDPAREFETLYVEAETPATDSGPVAPGALASARPEPERTDVIG